MADRSKTARIEYSPKYKEVRLTVPEGLKYEEVGKLGESLIVPELLEKLRHGCPTCLSGMPIVIREELENEVTVDLDKLREIRRP